MKLAITNLLPRRLNRQHTALEVEEELRFHLEMLERKFVTQGMSAAEAQAAATKRFGNLERVKQQCVHISARNSVPRRVLKMSSIVIALIGLSIHILASEYNVARIGDTLIMIALATRLLLYVRGLAPTVRN
jgi:hypothetical protein